MKTICRGDRFKGVIINPKKPNSTKDGDSFGSYFFSTLTIIAFIGIAVCGVHEIGKWKKSNQPSPPVMSLTESSAAKVQGDDPPGELTINGERWRVTQAYFPVSLGWQPGLDGLTDCSVRGIWYTPGQSVTQLRETMWHEVVHAGHCGKKDIKKANWADAIDSPEHEGVYALGMFLPSFVHDNPEFVEWSNKWGQGKR